MHVNALHRKKVAVQKKDLNCWEQYGALLG